MFGLPHSADWGRFLYIFPRDLPLPGIITTSFAVSYLVTTCNAWNSPEAGRTHPNVKGRHSMRKHCGLLPREKRLSSTQVIGGRQVHRRPNTPGTFPICELRSCLPPDFKSVSRLSPCWLIGALTRGSTQKWSKRGKIFWNSLFVRR